MAREMVTFGTGMSGRESVRHRDDERQSVFTGRPVRNLLALFRSEVMTAWSGC